MGEKCKKELTQCIVYGGIIRRSNHYAIVILCPFPPEFDRLKVRQPGGDEEWHLGEFFHFSIKAVKLLCINTKWDVLKMFELLYMMR